MGNLRGLDPEIVKEINKIRKKRKREEKGTTMQKLNRGIRNIKKHSTFFVGDSVTKATEKVDDEQNQPATTATATRTATTTKATNDEDNWVDDDDSSTRPRFTETYLREIAWAKYKDHIVNLYLRSLRNGKSQITKDNFVAPPPNNCSCFKRVRKVQCYTLASMFCFPFYISY